MIKVIDFLSRSMCVIMFSALLSTSWLYQEELNSLLGLPVSPLLNRCIHLLIVTVVALTVGSLLNWLFGRLLWHLERRQAIKQSPPIR
jgi:membrane protein YqaA with SNARE-associated domain